MILSAECDGKKSLNLQDVTLQKSNKEKIENMLMEDILNINGESLKNHMELMVNQIHDKTTLKLALNALIDTELLKFAHKLANKLDD